MKPREVFDVCLARYRGLGEGIGRRMAGVDMTRPSNGYLWRPENVRAAEYVADFEAAGARALKRGEWNGRRKLFVIYFLSEVDYKRAVKLVGVSENTFEYWASQVKKAVGRECARVGLFPPQEYFRMRRSYRVGGRLGRVRDNLQVADVGYLKTGSRSTHYLINCFSPGCRRGFCVLH